MKILRDAGYELRPEDLHVHVHAIGNGWRASNAEILRDVTKRINAGRVVQGIKTAPLGDEVLSNWRSKAAKSGRSGA